MAGSSSRTYDKNDPLSPLLPARTAGILGDKDAGAPDANAQLGDTQGPTGHGDGAAHAAMAGATSTPAHILQNPIANRMWRLSLPKNPTTAGALTVVFEWLTMRAAYLGRKSLGIKSLPTDELLIYLPWLAQDPRGWELFSNWLFGLVPRQADNLGELILDNQEWTDYMRAAPGLSDQIEKNLSTYVDSIVSTVDLDSSGKAEGRITMKYRAEVGGTYGSYGTGYQLLHGVNYDVGGLGVTGKWSVVRSKPNNFLWAYDVKFEDLQYVWNDIEDHNSNYPLDICFNDMYGMFAAITDEVDPVDYIVRIKWKAEAPISIRKMVPIAQ
jgi:hypothetical protein